jgi:hypothetical protein
MEQVSGKITRGQEVAYDDVGMWIDVKEQGGLKSWNGGFTLPPGTFVELGATYRVHLRDGRQGDMVIKKISVGSHKGGSVLFQGDGPLAR